MKIKKKIFPVAVLCLLLASLIPMGIFTTVTADWEDDNPGWLFKKELTLTNAINGYEMFVNVSYVDCESNCNVNFSDVRFLNYDEDTELNYWQESYVSGEYSFFWVKLSDDVEDDDKIYMYYGNDAVGYTGNGSEVFPYFSDWTVDTTGDWTHVTDSDARFIYNPTLDASISGGDNVRFRMKYQVDDTYYDANYVGASLSYGWRKPVDKKANTERAFIGFNQDTDRDADDSHYISYVSSETGNSPGTSYFLAGYSGLGGTYPPLSTGVWSVAEITANLTRGTVHGNISTDEGNFTEGETTNSPIEDSDVKFSIQYQIGLNPNEGSNYWFQQIENDYLQTRLYRSESIEITLNIDWWFCSEYLLVEPYVSLFGAEAEMASTGFVDGYPYAEKSFRINDFIQVSGKNFTLGGENYKIIGADSYYLADYSTNHTYDDDGNEINNSQQYVLEILNEANYLNINVIRTWAGTQGGNDSFWKHNRTGGHWNLFQIGEPGNWSETTYAALDWLVYQAKQRDIRLQLVLVNNWDDYGGMRWYAQQSPTTNKTHQWENTTGSDNWNAFHDQFYTDENCRDYFRNATEYLLTRNNTYTGIQYKDEPTIFSWLLANEPRANNDSADHTIIREWATNMTAHIKSIDTNHTVGLGIEGWGVDETWGEGTDFNSSHNGTGVDFATYAMHPDSWAWFAERSETDVNLDWMTDGTETDAYIDWWTNSTNLTYNNRWEGGFLPAYIPDEGRHGYEDWTTQNVLWANELDMPVLLQEVGYQTSHSLAAKHRFYNQSIKNFFEAGGDGYMFWTLNHDNYYYSTDTPGDMDDGYGFYLSNNETLQNKSLAVMDALDFAATGDGGDSYVTYLNDKTYDFVVNVTFEGETLVNLTLFLNITNSTTSRNVTVVNTTLISEVQWTHTYIFENDDLYVNWTAQLNTNLSQVNSSLISTQLATMFPTVTSISPADSYVTNLTSVTFNYTISSGLDIISSILYIDGAVDQINSTIDTGESYQHFTSTLSPGAHTWYVKSTDIDETYGTSETRDIEIDVPPNAPTTPIPTDNDNDSCLPVTLSILVSDMNGGTINVTFFDNSTDIQIGSMDENVTNNTRASVSWAGVVANTSYEWYVIVNDTLSNTTSAVYNFTTNAVPDITLNSIANNTNNAALTGIVLNWTASDYNNDVLSYAVYFGPSGSVSLQSANATVGMTHPLGTLTYGTTYNWYVIVTDECGATNTSETWTFSTREANLAETMSGLFMGIIYFFLVLTIIGFVAAAINKWAKK